eukprot:gb/GFBE01076004.1/.p1 GENE.gb/GFBE01076004.1/~~gb/GFBE01076004.1/.p1  ORF type:complete len:534 (+),score=98.99 gb/GFBE01076004.1/:1-1602(+)
MQHAERCQVSALAKRGCIDEERGISWSNFLRLVCRHCEPFGTCEPVKELTEAVESIWSLLQGTGSSLSACRPGALAVAVVHAQFSRAGLFAGEHNNSVPEFLVADLTSPDEASPDASAASPASVKQSWRRFLRPLLPFPLLASQRALYLRMDPVTSANLCSAPDAELFHSRRFLPLAEASWARCAVRRTDAQLLRTCRARRTGAGDIFKEEWGVEQIQQLRWLVRSAQLFDSGVEASSSLERQTVNSSFSMEFPGSLSHHTGFTPPSQVLSADLISRRKVFWGLRCPSAKSASEGRPAVDSPTSEGYWVDEEEQDEDMEVSDAHNMEKYKRRVAEGGCQSEKGLWGTSWQDSHKCVVEVVAERLGFRPGQLLLDWGSGCGHTLSWAKAYYDVDGIGIEATPSAASWASRFSMGKHCAIDGRQLGWVPDGLFDYVFSYAAITHLEMEEQCFVARQLVQKLRPGGKAFFGWNRAQRTTPWMWYDCFGQFGSGNTWNVESLEVIEEWHLFPEDQLLAVENFLWQFPAYSVLLTRRA